MPSNVMVGLKYESDDAPLLGLVREMIRPPAAVHLVTLVRVGKEGDERLRLDEAKRRVDDLAAELRAEGYEADGRAELCAIAPGTELARIASHRDADLIIIGMGRRSRVGKALLGSDAQSVLLHAGCPVLVARSD